MLRSLPPPPAPPAACPQAVTDGVLKVMSKMGISTIASYKGSQIFEALGLGADVVRSCFTGTASRIGGVSFEQLAADQLRLHVAAYGRQERELMLPDPGEFHFRCLRGAGECQGVWLGWALG